MTAAQLKWLAKTLVLVLVLFVGMQDTVGSRFGSDGDRQKMIASEAMGERFLLDWAASGAEAHGKINDILDFHKLLSSHEEDICHVHCAGSVAAPAWALPAERIWHTVGLFSVHGSHFFTSALPDTLYKPPIV